MRKDLDQYLDSAYTYSFSHGPDVVRSKEEALRYGLNCVALAHLALKDLFNIELPPKLKCLELFKDREYFMPVDQLEDIQVGDLVWFGVSDPEVAVDDFVPDYQNGQLINWREFPVKHVAVSTGQASEGYPLLHATHVTGTNSIWPLSKFSEYRRYKELHGITRLQIAN